MVELAVFVWNAEFGVHAHIPPFSSYLFKHVISQSEHNNWCHTSANLLVDARYIGCLAWLLIHGVVQLVFVFCRAKLAGL